MELLQILLLAAVLLFYPSWTKELPSAIQTCRADGSDFNECLRGAIQSSFSQLTNGIPELNILPLSVLQAPSAAIGDGKGVVRVVQNYKNFQIFGLDQGKVVKAEATVTPTHLEIDLEVFYDEGSFGADYGLNGRILLVPIIGEGKCKIGFYNATVHVHGAGGSFEKKGNSYFKIDDLTAVIKPSKMTFRFDNLFDGDKKLGDEMNKLLSDNWLDVFNDVKDGYCKLLGAMLKDYANKVLSKMSIKDLFFS